MRSGCFGRWVGFFFCCELRVSAFTVVPLLNHSCNLSGCASGVWFEEVVFMPLNNLTGKSCLTRLDVENTLPDAALEPAEHLSTGAYAALRVPVLVNQPASPEAVRPWLSIVQPGCR